MSIQEPAESPMRPEGVASELGATQDEMDLLPLKSLFDIEGNNVKDTRNLQTILGWLQSKNVSDRDAMNLEIRKTEMKLGAPQLGESRIGRLARYAILEGRLDQTIKEMQTYES